MNIRNRTIEYRITGDPFEGAMLLNIIMPGAYIPHRFAAEDFASGKGIHNKRKSERRRVQNKINRWLHCISFQTE